MRMESGVETHWVLGQCLYWHMKNVPLFPEPEVPSVIFLQTHINHHIMFIFMILDKRDSVDLSLILAI